MSTLENVLNAIDALPHTKRTRYKDGYKMNDPFNPSSDSQSFCIFDIRPDGEGATYKYFAGGEAGTLYDLAQKLGVKIAADTRAQAINTKKHYVNGLEDYAQAHGVSADYLTQCHWVETTHHGRPALQFKTAGGLRYRFLDGNAPYYISEKGYQICWYGLDDAINKANQANQDYILMCNGEISTLAGKFHNVPTFCKTSGESAIPQDLLNELNNKWKGKIVIALDCDDAGRKASKAIQSQLQDNGLALDLMLTDGGDLADFCRLHGDKTTNAIADLIQKQYPKPTTTGHDTNAHRSDAVFADVIQELEGHKPVETVSFLFPIKELRKFGGFAELCETGKVTLIAGGSGTGKTQFLETINDKLNHQGLNGFWFGAEWQAQEMIWRRIQRWSKRLDKTAVTYDDIRRHRLYLHDQQNGIYDSEGAPLSQAQLQAVKDVQYFFSHETVGTTEYFEDNENLSDVFYNMRIAIERERRNNRSISFVIFDYVQLLKASSPDSSVNRYEYAFELVKSFAIDCNVHVFMTSQVNKQNQSDISAGVSLGMESAHYVRGDKANLFLTLNRQYYKQGDDHIETNAFYLVIAKASLGGRPEGYNEPQLRIPMIMIPSQLTFNTVTDWRQINEEPFNRLVDNFYYTGGASFNF